MTPDDDNQTESTAKLPPDDTDTRQRYLEDYRQEIQKRQISNSEGYDKAVFSLATAFLGFSLAFLRDASKFSSSECKFLLPISWWCFGLTILLTIISLFVGEVSLDVAIEQAEAYYGGDEKAYDRRNIAKVLTRILNRTSGAFFLLAILATLLFTTINLPGRAMSESNDLNKLSVPTDLQRGLAAPSMPKLPACQPAPLNSPQGSTAGASNNPPQVQVTVNIDKK